MAASRIIYFFNLIFMALFHNIGIVPFSITYHCCGKYILYEIVSDEQDEPIRPSENVIGNN